MRKFIVTLMVVSGFVAMAGSSVEAQSHFGRIAFAKHQSPSYTHHVR
ncbi:MAG: hypothetical protein WAO83_10185 [Fuerstiella sp.]